MFRLKNEIMENNSYGPHFQETVDNKSLFYVIS